MEANPFLEGQLPIPDFTVTLSQLFKKAGYTTAVIGKWGLGAPNRQGFDYFWGCKIQIVWVVTEESRGHHAISI